jgi:hypothetical protein
MNKDFGIVLTTYVGDFYLTKGLLASIKKFAPELPICIIQDGDFPLGEALNTYNISHVIKKKDVKNDFLRDNCFGSRCTNMIAFWESPFEKFLYLDSDLVLWGNILRHINIEEADFFYNEPHEPYNEKIYKTQYFDYERLFDFVEKFNWQQCHFFNAGVFIGKRGILDLEKFKQMYWLWKKDKSLMPAEPQGMINYLIFLAHEKGELKASEKHLQTIVPVWSIQQLETTFSFSNNEPVVKQDTVVHWAGIKPLMMNKDKVFIAPEKYFRKLHLKNIGSLWYYLPDVYFYYEEYLALLNRYHQGSILVYTKKKLQRIIA